MPSTLTEAITASATLILQQNITENDGKVDFTRYQSELSAIMSPYISDLEEKSLAWKGLYDDLMKPSNDY